MNNVLQFEARKPPDLNWYIRIDGGPSSEPGFYWKLPGKPPKRFHQWMMRLCFGWRITNEVEGL
jgi:hypothetical protein